MPEQSEEQARQPQTWEKAFCEITPSGFKAKYG